MAGVSLDQLAERLQCTRSGCPCSRGPDARGQYVRHCPAHDDRSPSLALAGRNGRLLVHCFGGCSQEALIDALRARDLWPERAQRRRAARQRAGPVPPSASGPGLTLETLAEAKRLPAAFLSNLGVKTVQREGQPAVRIPYLDADGTVRTVRFRLGLTGGNRFTYRTGDRVLPYGLDRLAALRAAGWVLLVEGETDCWTAWHHGLPALGIPGKATWKPAWAPYCAGLAVYVWQEPDAADFTARIARDLPDARVILAPPGVKDLSEAQVQGLDVPALLATWKAEALPIRQAAAGEAGDREALAAAASPVLAHPDPLVLVDAAIAAQRFGGDRRGALLTYLAATSRVLRLRPGQMPVHLLLLGPASAGKSYTLRVVLNLLPALAFHTIDAGSPRVLIYDTADLVHRLVIFSEADSLPAGEDNPAASAIRNLLQDHRLHYLVTVRDADTGDFTVREIDKPGPSVLITTATRRLGQQLDTRVFVLDVPDDQHQLTAALQAQAALEVEGAVAPDAALIAFQTLLQLGAPWDVIVPYAPALAAAVGNSPAASRILRDYARLLSLIKAVTVLRHRLRERDGADRLVATLDDYTTVYDLVNDVYDGSAHGASVRIRETVAAVTALLPASGTDTVTVRAVATDLQLNKMTALRRVNAAIRSGFLVNHETRKHFPAALGLGEALPAEGGLPTVADLERLLTSGHPASMLLDAHTAVEDLPDGRKGNRVTRQTDGNRASGAASVEEGVRREELAEVQPEARTGNTVTPLTVGSPQAAEASQTSSPTDGIPTGKDRYPVTPPLVTGVCQRVGCTAPQVWLAEADTGGWCAQHYQRGRLLQAACAAGWPPQHGGATREAAREAWFSFARTADDSAIADGITRGNEEGNTPRQGDAA